MGKQVNQEIELGDRVKDSITGLSGIVYGITQWLYGCRRITIQPQEVKDSHPVQTFTVDEPQLVILEKGVIASAVQKAAATGPGGPRPDAEPRPNITR